MVLKGLMCHIIQTCFILIISVRVVLKICICTTQKYTVVFSHQSYQNELIGCLVVKSEYIENYLFVLVLVDRKIDK